MQDKEDHKNRKKMNTLELLYNKALMKAAADNAENVKKTKVWSAFIWIMNYWWVKSYLCR